MENILNKYIFFFYKCYNNKGVAMKKEFIFLLLILMLSGCKKEITPEDSLNILMPNTTVFEYGDLVKLNDIFDNENITFKDDYLDLSILGDNEIDIEYTSNDNLYKEKFKYQVVDTTAPLIWVSSSYSITVGDTTDLLEKIICADNYDKKPNCYIEGNYNANKKGNYNLKFIATDSNGNTEEANFTLTIKDKETKKNNSNDERIDIKDVIKKYKNDNTLIGIDVSLYQGDIDWKKVKDSGVEFAMIRLGLGWEDVLKLDEYFLKNIKGALDNDIKVGIYFYSYAQNEKEAIYQANYVIDTIKDYNVTMPIAFDWENFKRWYEFDINLTDLRKITYAFQDTILNAGYTPVQYGSRSYLNAFWAPMKYDTWLALYYDEVHYDGDYIMWQRCATGKVDGIKGNVDIDIYYKEKVQ